MPLTSSIRQRSQEDTVRLVLDQVYEDFCKARPSPTLALQHPVSRPDVDPYLALCDAFELELEIGDDSHAKFDDAAKHIHAHPRPASLLVVQSEGRQSKPQTPTHQITPRLCPPPYYSFCVRVQESDYTAHEEDCPFLPTFGNESRFNEDEYAGMFSNLAWTEPGRDSDVDLILIETRARLLDMGFTDEDIDKTHVLLYGCDHIAGIPYRRETYSFPRFQSIRGFAVGDYESLEERGWAEMEPGQVERVSILQEREDDLYCAKGNCTRYACLYHDMSQYPPSRPVPPITTELHCPRPKTACSPTCDFMYNTNNTLDQSQRPTWSGLDKKRLERYVASGWVKSCQVSKAFRGHSCHDVAVEARSFIRLPPSPPTSPPLGQAMNLEKPSKKPSKNNDRLEMSDVSNPCDHEGPCSVQRGCHCATNELSCEYECLCSSSCERRFRGCDCRKAIGNKSARCQRDSCACVLAKRECVEALCGSCGAREILAAGSAIPGMSLCGNVPLQMGESAHVRVGISTVSGYGAFAGEDILAKTLIFEYVGEYILASEADKRDLIAKEIGRSYLFGTIATRNIDGMHMANESRYPNSPAKTDTLKERKRKENCFAKVMYVDGNHRIGLYAQRDIMRGEELLFQYGDLSDVMKRKLGDGKGKSRSKTGQKKRRL